MIRHTIASSNREKANRSWHERNDSKRLDPLHFLYHDDDKENKKKKRK
jgi:hypothetical protein